MKYIDKEFIIKEMLPTIKRIAMDLSNHLPPNVEVDDLIQEGVLALISSLEKYDPKRASLKTFVLKRIKGAMYDYLRKMDWMPRNLRRSMKIVEQKIYELSANGRIPSDEEISKATGIDLKEVRRVKNEMVRKQLLMLDEYLSEDIGIETHDTDDPAKQAYRETLFEYLREVINELSEREKLILSLRFEHDLSLKEIGKVLNISESRVSQILSSVFVKLRKKLEGLV
ncbi:MAG: FliA/WhiG family RNA polymerase sigma factor [Thermotogae bacterium]|nr:MAG: FliA/WhiG family RNA polymerase sigma factor [Thermotogota bacterium]RKX54325.1 MAG: FliA/WhiG family RNA polymerase sigma factor [Thermotoga sp.]HDG61547.1 FliA/WhiG family RNA polymerase sigma factor [Thermotoga sp.]